jgi:hypothetical protein
MLNLKSSLVHDILREVFEAILPQLTRPNGRQLVLATNFSQIYCKDAKKDLIKSPVLATMKSVPEATDPPAKKWGQQIHLEMEGTIHFQVQKATTTNNKKRKKKKKGGGEGAECWNRPFGLDKNKNGKKVVQGSYQRFINQPNHSSPQTGRVLETPRPFGDTMPGWSLFPIVTDALSS